MFEIRWHGRGGQGVVTASELLAETALAEGKYFQSFPDYGPERMGAPIRAYTRISDVPIPQHNQITEPDAVIVLDPTLIGVVDFVQGLKSDGILIINIPLSPTEIREKVNYASGKVYTLDASSIALSTIKRNIPNLPMIGALLRAVEIVSKEGAMKATRERLGAKFSEEMVKANIEALERAYRETREG
jgi:pyruvate ferredoxin oxidoreductase gamma subunit